MAGLIGIFETQRRSEWVQEMLRLAEVDFGHGDVGWRTRALLAIPDAGIEGMCLTSTEMELKVSPLIGMAEHKEYRSRMVTMGLSYGIIEETGEMRRPEGKRNMMPLYRIVGHMEMHEDSIVPVLTEKQE